MSGLTVKFERSYRSKKGNVVFVYVVDGSDAELASYAEALGEFHVEDEELGAPLWFTTRFIGKSGSLIVTSKGKVVADMSKFDQARSLVEQYGGNFGDTLASALMSDLVGSSTPPPAVVQAPVAEIAPPVGEAKPTDLDQV